MYVFLLAGVLIISQSANIIRIGQASPVAISAWRLGIAAVLFALISGRQVGTIAKLSGRQLVLLVFSGVTLALHFFSWIYAVQQTTVANATVFFATNPIFVAVAAFVFYREAVGKKLMISILLGLGGVLIIGLDGLSLSTKHMAGNAWALVCAVLFSVYFMLGKRLRRWIATDVYVTSVYGVAAVVSFGCLVWLQEPVFLYNQRTWLCFVLMALLPTMVGHTAFNHALRYLKAGWISAVTLTEPLLAGMVAYWVWGEQVTYSLLVGYGLICLSVALLIFERPHIEQKPA